MQTAEHCRAMAAEAERLADIVSYGRDKARLAEQAKTWRDRADALEAERASMNAGTCGGEGRVGLMGWLRRRVG